jgi:hypothetical protein
VGKPTGPTVNEEEEEKEEEKEEEETISLLSLAHVPSTGLY